MSYGVIYYIVRTSVVWIGTWRIMDGIKPRATCVGAGRSGRFFSKDIGMAFKDLTGPSQEVGTD